MKPGAWLGSARLARNHAWAMYSLTRPSLCRRATRWSDVLRSSRVSALGILQQKVDQGGAQKRGEVRSEGRAEYMGARASNLDDKCAAQASDGGSPCFDRPEPVPSKGRGASTSGFPKTTRLVASNLVQLRAGSMCNSERTSLPVEPPEGPRELTP